MNNVLQFPSTKIRTTAERNQLVEQHLHLVRPIAERVKAKMPPSIQLDDLISCGNFGLIDAAERFDDTLGVPFAAYCRRRIHGEILQHHRRKNYREACHDAIDDHHYELSDTALEDAETIIEVAQIRRTLEAAMGALDRTEKKVLEMHYFGEADLNQVGAKIERHPSRASQLHRQALRTMKTELNRRGLKAA